MTGDERTRLEVIEAKVDTIIVKLDYLKEDTADHESRLRSVERWKYAIPASVLVLAGAVASSLRR